MLNHSDCSKGDMRMLVPPTMAESQSPLCNASHARCRAIIDEEQPTLIVILAFINRVGCASKLWCSPWTSEVIFVGNPVSEQKVASPCCTIHTRLLCIYRMEVVPILSINASIAADVFPTPIYLACALEG